MPTTQIPKVTSGFLTLYETFASKEANGLAKKHRTAMACRDLEDCLAIGVTLYRQITDLDREWRLAWARGTAKATKAQVAFLEGLFSRWLAASKRYVAPLEWCQSQNFAGGVEHAQEWRECYEEALAAENEELATAGS